MFSDKTLLITGGTGSFGSTVLERFINSDIKSNNILFNRMEELYEKYKIPRLCDYGYGKENINQLAKNISSSLEGSFAGNPVPFDLQSAIDILEKQID